MLEIQNMINCSTKDIKDIVVTDEYIIIVGREGLIYINDKNNNLLGKFNPESGNVNSLAFDGKIIYAGCQNGNINLCNIHNIMKSSLSAHTGNVCCLELKGHTLLSGSWDHSLKVWDITEKSIIVSIDHPGTVWCASFIDENRFVTGCAIKY